MEYRSALDYLNSHIGLGVRPGLERMTKLMELMGRPDQGYPIIHVAGTNGKTSTSRMATWLLVAHGLNTGTYTSPHLQVVEERLAVNGRFASEEEFALAVSDVAAFAQLLEERDELTPTYFELTTAASFAFFADQAVDAAVLEVGLGGRLDATNVVDAEVCVVTTIGIEHIEYLGSDVASIAAEKLGIVGLGAILVTGPLPEAALVVADATTRRLGIQHRHFGQDFGIDEAEPAVGGWLASIRGAEGAYEEVFLPLHGSYQLINLANAVASVEALIGRKLDRDAVQEACSAASIPGRMEPLGADPFVMVDGAHNADAMAVLADSLATEFPTTQWLVILGVMGDKNVEAMLEHLRPLASRIVVTAAHSDRVVPPADLAIRVGGHGFEVEVAPDIATALEVAKAAVGPDEAILVTGSLYLVGEARDLLIGRVH